MKIVFGCGVNPVNSPAQFFVAWGKDVLADGLIHTFNCETPEAGFIWFIDEDLAETKYEALKKSFSAGCSLNITYKLITSHNIEICRDLCNALMAHQADQGVISPEILRAMSFDNRLKPSFESAAEKQLIVAFDGEKPVGYVFSSAELETDASKMAKPNWALGLSGTGFYPDWLSLPAKIGCLNNLYVLPEYRGQQIATALCDRAMDWLRNVSDIKYIYVYISNGNDRVIEFYKSFGFEYSHEVFNGFIVAYYQRL